MIIGISGRAGSGKDTVGKIIQYLEDFYTLKEMEKTVGSLEIPEVPSELDYYDWLSNGYDEEEYNDWKIKKFAGKLKQVVSILTGISTEDLEKQEVKDSILSPEWQVLITTPTHENTRYTESTVRWLLQTLGTDLLREQLHPDVWVNALFADYKKFCYNDLCPNHLGFCNGDNCSAKFPDWIITDVRFPNEVKAIKERKGVIWKVVRPCEYCNTLVTETYSHKMGCERPNKQEHESETILDDYKEFDEIIVNNGSIEELTQKVKTAFHKLKQTK